MTNRLIANKLRLPTYLRVTARAVYGSNNRACLIYSPARRAAASFTAMQPANATNRPPAEPAAASHFTGELGPDDPLDALHQDRATELITALFNRPEVLAADVGLDTEVRPIPAFSDANLRRLAASAVDQILSLAPVSSDIFFADAINDYDEATKLGALFGTLFRMG